MRTSPPHLSHSKYRPEIDGLRAIAVVSVVLFHAHLGVPGGFIGVDVFFVISGFLITSLILRDLVENRFRLADFWERRARRILPALLPTTLAALLISMILLPPTALESAARSATWLGAFASNVYFYRTIGYFSAPAEGLPLLHTWSLAVEEQFYLLFPLLLVGGFALVRRSRRRLFTLVLLLAGVSLAMSVRETNTNPTGAFYLLHTRAFELLLGALLAFVPGSAVERWGRMREVLSLGGLALIGWACLRFTKDTPFPGLPALVPCGGAGLFILGNMGDRAPDAPPITWSGRALAWRPVVFVGLVSYSFYLWHWPPLAIMNHWHIGTNTPHLRVISVLVTFLCAVLSWRFVERPFRQTRAPSRRFVVAVAAALSMAGLVAFGWGIAKDSAVLSRVPSAAYAWLGAIVEPRFAQSTEPHHVRTKRLPVFGVNDPNIPASVLLWGDSHAMAVAGVMDEVCRETGRKGYIAAHLSSAPLHKYYSWGKYALNELSIPYADAVFQLIKQDRIREVVLVAYWSSYFDEYPSGAQHPYELDQFSIALLRTIKELQALGVRVIFQRQTPSYMVSVPEELAWRTIFGWAPPHGDISLSDLRHHTRGLDALERDVIATGVIVVDSVAALSPGGGPAIVASGGQSLYSDGNHLAIPGAARLLPAYRAAFAEASRR